MQFQSHESELGCINFIDFSNHTICCVHPTDVPMIRSLLSYWLLILAYYSSNRKDFSDIAVPPDDIILLSTYRVAFTAENGDD